MKFGLEDSVVARIQGVFAAFPQVARVVVYGSRAKGTFRPGSDIDLALTGNALTLKDLYQISLALDDLYLPYTFDMALHHQIANPDLLDHIRRVGQPFYEAATANAV